MNGSDRIVEILRDEGIDAAFGYPGGAIMPFYDALVGSGIKHLLMRHEQAAAHAAEGYALATGGAGVCIATSGPGATNLVTGLADAMLDSVPIVAITGQVPTPLIGTDAFQEVDIFGITLPVVKHSFLAETPRLAEQLRLAFHIATSGRPGPVLVDLPKDVQLAESPEPKRRRFPTTERSWDATAIEAAARLLRDARRPLIYAGGGIHQGRALGPFRQLVERLQVPVVSTLKGLGALPSGHPRFLGMMGMHGSGRANRALGECDLLLVLGARFDDRATGKLDTFCPQAKVIHCDIDPAEVGKLRAPEVGVVGPLAETLPALFEEVAAAPDWHRELAEPPADWPFSTPCPRDLLESIDADIVTTDVGQHQMWAAQFLRLHEGTQLMTSGGLGTMGFGLPAAIGAQVARPDAKVVCISGDGSLMMMIHELATVARYRLPIKIVLFDNGCLGMVRQWQELFFAGQESEVDLSDNPDFLALAGAFGIPGRRVTRSSEVASAMEETTEADGPFLLHCAIERGANVWPLVPPGAANHTMLTGAPPPAESPAIAAGGAR